MRRIGTVVRTAQGLLIVRVPESWEHPPVREAASIVGTAVLDDSLADVGTVVDLFGPVDRPYLAVSPDEDVRSASVVGATLYSR